MAFEMIKDQIKQAPLSQVIQYFIPLTRKGQNLEALCPFHSDTKPSLKVNDQKGLYKCFACGAGGDAINFVKEYKKIDFIDALKECAQLLGISTEEFNQSKKKNPKLEMAYRVLNASTKIYKKFSEQGAMNFNLFINNRKLNPTSIEMFQLGYAPVNSALYHYLQTIPAPDQELALKTALELGLIKPSQHGDGYYDFYRDRILFPIHDHQGQVRGFSSRAIHADQIPKYLNSGDSFAFHKGSILYGYFLAKNTIRSTQEVILVEGNMDVVMMHQHGFNQTVGTMGTALTEQNLKLLTNIAQKIYLAMDSDPAGMKAQKKINADLMSKNVLAYFIDFSPSKDPDDFLKENGRIALKEKIDNAPLLIDYLIQQEIPKQIPENLSIKLKIMKTIFELLAPLKDHLNATERLIKAAKDLGFQSDATSILDDYRQFLNKNERAHTPNYTPPTTPVVNANEPNLDNEPVIQEIALAHPSHKEVIAPMHSGEKILLKTLLTHPECLDAREVDEILAYVMHPEVKQMVPWLAKMYQEIDETEYVSIVSGEFFSIQWTDETKKIVADALFNYTGLKLNDKVKNQVLKDLRLKMQVEKLKEKRKEFANLQKTCQSLEEINYYMSEITLIDRELHQIKQSPVSHKE